LLASTDANIEKKTKSEDERERERVMQINPKRKEIKNTVE
jgi:hypothetical protein